MSGTNLRSSLFRKKKLLLQTGLNFGQDIKLYDSWHVCSRGGASLLLGQERLKVQSVVLGGPAKQPPSYQFIPEYHPSATAGNNY